MSNFDFLAAEWPEVYREARRAERSAHLDPRTACFYARRALEFAVNWVYSFDRSLHIPYEDNISTLIHEPTFKALAGESVFTKARLIIRLGNQAVHSQRPVQPQDSMVALRELFHVCYWLARTYGRGAHPAPNLAFDPTLVPTIAPIPRNTREQLQKLEADLQARDDELAALRKARTSLDEELERLRAEVAEAKKASAAQLDTHDYSEAETRDYFIDLLLHEAGWDLDQPRDREFQVHGMPTGDGVGFVDYVLWGTDGKPLALVEAKRTKHSAPSGQHQAKLYADCLEAQFGQRPVIFYSNGYEHWLWDDLNYPPRLVQGFFNKSDLELMIQRRNTRKALVDATVNENIVERYYQNRAIRRITEAFEKHRERKALLVMATGAGKTRTVIALVDLLIRCNWAKRVLFLADRIALVNQAVGAFKTHLPDAAPVNLVAEKDTEGRVYVSTYPTMMGLIEDVENGQRRFSVGHFDLIIIDEAHRSVYQKYRAIFEYFDSLLVGLTATPKDEVDVNTYRLFDLERGVPTDAYDLDDAVKDGFLVRAEAVSVPLKFEREGIKYDELTEDEKDAWDAIDWSENGGAPSYVEPAALNQWLFNKDTVDKALEHLMTHGQKVAGGDRLGKTIIFAKNQAHAEFIAQRFDASYPQYKGTFARVIHSSVPYAQTLIDDFSNPDRAPHIAISVDMLDTGIDIPEVVNLVFLKMVRSKTKFWQMVGRGTRLRKDLFGPDQDKEFFYIFDYCQNLEFFGQNPPVSEGSLTESLSQRLFKMRVELIDELDHAPEDAIASGTLRQETADLLRTHVAAMNPNNFVVRPKRRLVEKYAQTEWWGALDLQSVSELENQVAGLPTELEAEDEEAKRFDLLILTLQLALLRTDESFTWLRDQVRRIADLLEEKANIPMVQQQLAMIQEVQSDEWWKDVTLPMLESARKGLRSLVKLIEKQKRKPVYTDFEDQLGEARTIALPGLSAPDTFTRFRAKVRAFLAEHEDLIVVHKLRMARPLTTTDLQELERLLVESGIGGAEDIQRAKEQSNGLGLFVRSLVGLDRQAAKEAFAGFISGKTLTANQIEFVDMIVNHLTDHGVMEAKSLYESPFTDLAPHGPEGIFSVSQVDELVAVLDQVAAVAQIA